MTCTTTSSFQHFPTHPTHPNGSYPIGFTPTAGGPPRYVGTVDDHFHRRGLDATGKPGDGLLWSVFRCWFVLVWPSCCAFRMATSRLKLGLQSFLFRFRSSIVDCTVYSWFHASSQWMVLVNHPQHCVNFSLTQLSMVDVCCEWLTSFTSVFKVAQLTTCLYITPCYNFCQICLVF